MNTILEQYAEKINGTFAHFDRIIIKGHIRQFFSSSGKGFFLSEKNVLLKDFSKYAEEVTADVVGHAGHIDNPEAENQRERHTGRICKRKAEFCKGKQNFVRESTALKSYNTTVQRYSQLYKQLTDLMPKTQEAEKSNAVYDFIKGGGT